VTNSLYRALGVAIDGRSQELTANNCQQLLANSSLVIDAFDNSMARRIIKDYCLKANLPCLHTGLAKDYAEVIWNEFYRIPSDVNDDVCDYPLARNLVMLTVAVACEVIIRFIATEQQENYTLTLEDFAVKFL
ncbi:MAG: ThiF family adenylyltransferase, partial [Spirulinaceae cyanobacterium]